MAEGAKRLSCHWSGGGVGRGGEEWVGWMEGGVGALRWVEDGGSAAKART